MKRPGHASANLGAKKAGRVKGQARPAIPATELPLAPGDRRCFTLRMTCGLHALHAN
jgi:hypothetical protein